MEYNSPIMYEALYNDFIEDKIYNVLPASVEEFFQKEVVSKLE